MRYPDSVNPETVEYSDTRANPARCLFDDGNGHRQVLPTAASFPMMRPM
jgi:hypothetical protein